MGSCLGVCSLCDELTTYFHFSPVGEICSDCFEEYEDERLRKYDENED